MKMQKTFKLAGWLLSALMATVFTSSAEAGLKYWTTGNYDADSYVQDGLVLHYDGIRNVGINQPHSMTTTTWKNLGSGGSTYDLARYYKTAGSGTSNTYTAGDKYGEWAEDGFVFNRDAYFGTSGSVAFPAAYSVQLLIDATVAEQPDSTCGYVVFPDSDWKKISFALRTSTSYGSDGAFYSVFDTTFGATTRPYFNTDSKTTPYSYGTAIVSGNTAMFFNGTTYPTSGNSIKTASASATVQTVNKLRIGGGQGGQDFTGTVKSFRVYHSVLSEDDLTWNRTVDQARYFGAAPASTIPVTNAVIASSIAVVHGKEKSGAYAVDASGYTFSAPASRTVEGREYTCTGYTLETWGTAEGDWGAPVSHDGELSCTVMETSRVRITWRWTPGDGIVTRYDVGDYVQNGLLLNYDGIRNEGAGEPHSFAPAKWVNLAPGGGLDMTLQVINTEGADPGEWRRDGYHFECQSYFHPGTAFTLPSNQTIQVAVDANGLGQKAYNGSADSNEAYIYYASGVEFNKAGSLSLRRDTNTSNYNEWFDWTVHGYGDSNTRPKPSMYRGLPVRYCTAVLADTFGAAFMGTSVPTEETGVNGSLASRRNFTSGPPIVQNATDFGIGGLIENNGRKFTGTLQSFRFYGRVLTDAELEHNRMVDDYRFHGVIPVTNVVVASSRLGMEGNEKIGPYEISGRYTFTAPASRTDARGFTFACTGYTLEAWNASSGCWDAPVLHDGDLSFEYVVANSPAKVRLVWRWKAVNALFAAADYDITDYVAGGLVLNYDGIKNLGADLPDVTGRFSSLSRAWANSAPFGGYDMGFNKKGGASTWLGDSTWTDNGFTFTNNSFFSYSGVFTVSPKSTQQTLVDGIGNSLDNGGSLDNGSTPRGYVFMASGAWNKAGSLSFVCNGSGSADPHSWVDLPAHGFSGTTSESRCDPCLAYGAQLTYATGIMGDGYMAAFYGTEIPSETTTRWRNPSRLPTTGFGLEPTTVTVSYLGAGGSAGGQPFTGTVKSYRYYDRPLTNEELKHNRNVDSARFFGELATTNVFVVAGGEGAVQAEAGAYKVEGEWTFTASKTLDKDGNVVDVVRYSVEMLDNGVWKKRFYNGNSYTYTEGTDPATVRLTWLPEPLGMVIIVK